jgi:hypothetical protein
MFGEIIPIYETGVEIIVNLPDYYGKESPYKATWVRHISRNVYEMAFGVTSWLVHINSNKLITPISCADYIYSNEDTILNLCTQLHISKDSITEKLYKDRIKEFYKSRKDLDEE